MREMVEPAGRTAGALAPLFVGAEEQEELARLRATVALAPVGIAHFAPDGRFLLANPQLCAILGYSREELASRTFPELTYAEDLPRCLALTAELAAGRIPRYVHEKRFVRRDGSVVWVRVTVSAVRRRDGTPDYFVGVAADITAQRVEEEARREAEARFRTLADAIPQLAWMADATGAIHWYNQRWYAFTGTTLAQMQGWGWQQVHHPDHVARVVARIRECFETGEPWEDTFPLRGRDGAYRWFLSRALPLRDAAGRVTGWFGTNTDITELRAAEQAVREKKARLRRIADSGIVGVFYWTQAGGITEANAEFCRMVGLTEEDVREGRASWRSLTPPEWTEVDAAKLEELAARGFTSNWEKEFVAADGRRVPVLLGAALLEGSADHGLAVCLDIGDRKRAEAERERLLEGERSARAAAERASQLRDEVMAVVAHDLRNPVNTIVLSAGALLELPLDEGQRRHRLGVIQRTAGRMDGLIRDLLDASRIEAGTFAVRHARVHVRALLDETLELFEAQAHERGVALRCEVGTDVPPVLGDRDRLVQVFSNLLGNALKFTPAGGEVRISARPVPGASPRGAVELAVADTGSGIPPDHLAHVFDRFWQADRQGRAGAGLGLAIVKGIVEAHGGDIRVASVVGAGTTFAFTLPEAPARQG